MGKIFLILSAVFSLFSISSYAGHIQMFQYDAPLNTAYLQKVSINQETIVLEGAILPCSSHPDFPKTFGDLYVCMTTRTQVFYLLNNNAVRTMSDQALADWLLKQDFTWNCATSGEPQRIPYMQFTAFQFTGPVTGLAHFAY